MISISRESALVPEGHLQFKSGTWSGRDGSLAAYSEFEIYYDWMIWGSIFHLFGLIEFSLKNDIYKHIDYVADFA